MPPQTEYPWQKNKDQSQLLELVLEAERRGILPENKVTMLAEARKRGLISGGTPQAEQTADSGGAPQTGQPAEGILSRAAKNLPSSAGQFAKDITAPIHSPVQTVKGVGAVVEGTVQKLIKDRWRDQGVELDKEGSEQAAEAMGNFITDRYGGVENIKETIAEDPVGFLADIATVFTGGAGAVAKAAGIAGKAGRVASVAGQVGKVAEKVGAVGRAIEPAAVIGKVGSMAAKQITKGAGKAISEVLGVTTGASPTPIRIAYASGKAGGEKGEMFLKSMRNKIPMDEVVEEARLAVGNMHKAKMEAYRSGLDAAFKNKKTRRERVVHAKPVEGLTEAINSRRADGEYYPRRYEPIHEVKDWGKVEKIVRSALDGDDVQPFLIDGQPGNGNLLTGTHRAAANDILRELDGPEIGHIELDSLPPKARDRINEYIEIEDFRADGIDDVFDEIYPKTKPAPKADIDREGIGKAFKDTPETPIDFGKVKDKIGKSLEGGTFKGRDISKSTAKAREAIKAQLDEWESLDPKEFHTVEGMDAFRKSIGDILDSTEYGSPARKVANQSYFAVRKAIEDQAPGYGKVLEEYHLASKHLSDLEQALSLGKKSGTETALRKLQAVMRDDVTSAYGKRAEYAKELKKAGATGIEEKLAGQALQPYAPRGLRGYITGGVAGGAAVGAAPGMLPVALAAGSPRLVGSAAHRLGQGRRTLSRMARPIGSINLRRTATPEFQAGRAGRVAGQEDE